MNEPKDFDPADVPPVVRRRPERTAAPQRPRPEGARPRPEGARPRPDGARRAPRDQPQRRVEDDEYVVLPRSTSGGRRLLAVAGIVVLVAGVLIGSLMIWVSRQIDPPGDPGELVAEVEIPSGSSVDAIGSLLAEEDIIASAQLFRRYAGWKDAGPWNAGTYVDFRTSMSFDEAIEVLDAGPVPPEASVLRIVEGRRLVDALAEIAEQLEGITVEQLEEALASGAVTSRYLPAGTTNWEGFLFPDTYRVQDDATAVDVLQMMVSQMDSVLDELGYDRAEALQGRTAYELVTIASLVEKETGAPPEERGMISRTISNRLDDGETLGIDAAVLYGLGRANGSLSTSDLETDTPYNTRTVVGLPPTPIALPGRASLAAAIAPTEGSWKWYVLTENDPPAHFFTDSYREFVNAKNDAQARGVF